MSTKRNYTYKDHFRFGWGDGLYNFEDNNQQFWVDYGKVERTPLTFREECVNAAKLIGESADRPILVCFSGGVDSEVILRSMLEAKVECQALIVNLIYNNSVVNEYDTEYAFKFVKKHNVKYQTFNFNFNDFMRYKILDDVHLYRAARPGLLVHSDIVRIFCKDYLCILGGGDINMARSRLNGYPESDGMYITEDHVSVSAIHAAFLKNENVVNRFFMYTPELMLSWLTCEDIKTLVKYEKSCLGITSYNIKPFIFHKQWPDLEPRPKYTGYENIDLFLKKGWPTADQELVKIMKEVSETEFSKTSIDIPYGRLIDILTPNENFTPVC